MCLKGKGEGLKQRAVAFLSLTLTLTRCTLDTENQAAHADTKSQGGHITIKSKKAENGKKTLNVYFHKCFHVVCNCLNMV